jgi:peptidoglycan/LPS O-acetylase OafA/YrhL
VKSSVGLGNVASLGFAGGALVAPPREKETGSVPEFVFSAGPVSFVPNPPAKQKTRIAAADAFRALAIFLVVAYHVLQMAQPTWHGRPHVFGELGVWGVDCFFVLSGLLLGGEYVRSLLAPTIVLQSPRVFFVKRVLRIVPLYFACVLLSIVFNAAFLHVFPTAKDVVAHLLFLQDFDSTLATSINGPFWTMPVDMEFYLLLPVYAGVMAAIFRANPTLPRRTALFASLAAITTIGLMYRLLVAKYNPVALQSFSNEIVWVRNVIGMSGAFCLGIALSIISTMKIKPMPIVAVMLLAFAGALEFVVTRTNALEGGPISNRLIFGQTIFDFAGALSVALIMYVVVEGDYGFVNKLVKSKIVLTLAALAYGVYLIHYPIANAVSPFFKDASSLERVFGITLATIVPTLCVAYIANRFVEQRFLRMKGAIANAPSKGAHA